MMDRKSSVGITTLGIIFIFITAPAFLGGFVIAIAKGHAGEITTMETLIKLFFIIFPIGFLVSGIGLLMLSGKARILALIISVIISLNMFLLAINCILQKDLFVGTFALGAALFFIMVIYYLTRHKVKGQFK